MPPCLCLLFSIVHLSSAALESSRFSKHDGIVSNANSERCWRGYGDSCGGRIM